MAQRRTSNRYDILLDGNKFKIVHGEVADGYQHAFQHVSVNEQERYSPEGRGNMQSRPDLRGFVQSDWSGGQTWFKPTLPSQDGNSYFQASMFDAWTKPGNLVPLNKVTQVAGTTSTQLDQSGALAVVADGSVWTVGDATKAGGTTTDMRQVFKWTPASDNWVVESTVSGGPVALSWIHGLLNHPALNVVYTITGPSPTTVDTGRMTYWIPDTGTVNPDYVSATGTLTETHDYGPGSSIFFFDGRLMTYDMQTVKWLADPGGFTTVTDDSLGRDLLWNSTFMNATSSGGKIVDIGSMDLATATDRGVFYIKNVKAASGLPQARIFKVEVTDARSYIRSPLGSLPEGLVALNIRWFMDSLLIIATPDWGLLSDNDRGQHYMRTQLWHYTQGSIGAVGTFDGETSPSESPIHFGPADGTIQYIQSDQRVWAFDSIRGGIHQMFDYPTPFASGFVNAAQTRDSSTNEITLWLGDDYWLTQIKPWIAAPNTGNWAAKSYTLVSNYFDFGLDMETKQLTSVTCLFEKGASTETYFIDVQDDDDGTWTTVATMTCDNGNVPITTDITSLNITGNRFQYRVRLQVDSGTNMPEFRGIKFRALSGETVEIWDLQLDGSEIVNIENEKQDPNVVFANLRTSALKNVFVQMTDYYGRSDADLAAVDARIDNVVITKGDSGESIINVRLTKVDV